MFGTDDVRLGQLDGARSYALVSAVVGRGTADTMDKFLVVFHHGITWIVTGARVTRVVRAVDGAIDNLVLRPDGELGQTRFMEELSTSRHVATCQLPSLTLSTHSTHVSASSTVQTFKLLHTHFIRVDPDTGWVIVG